MVYEDICRWSMAIPSNLFIHRYPTEVSMWYTWTSAGGPWLSLVTWSSIDIRQREACGIRGHLQVVHGYP